MSDIIPLLVAAAFGAFGAAGLLANLPVNTCPECSHCRRLTREKEQRSREYADSHGIATLKLSCPQCGRDHHVKEDPHDVI